MSQQIVTAEKSTNKTQIILQVLVVFACAIGVMWALISEYLFAKKATGFYPLHGQMALL